MKEKVETIKKDGCENASNTIESGSKTSKNNTSNLATHGSTSKDSSASRDDESSSSVEQSGIYSNSSQNKSISLEKLKKINRHLTKMFLNAKRYFERKVKKLNYIHTKLPEDYEMVNEDYRRIRDQIYVLEAVIKSLTNYEFGGTILKNFSDLANQISLATNVSSIKRDDIYTDVSFILLGLSQALNNNKSKSSCLFYSEAYEKISKAKVKMNEKLNKINEEEIKKEIRIRCKELDLLRNKVKDLRYDLEELLQSNIYKEEEKLSLENELKELSQRCLNEMKEFCEISNISDILTSVTNAHLEFTKTSSIALKKALGLNELIENEEKDLKNTFEDKTLKKNE